MTHPASTRATGAVRRVPLAAGILVAALTAACGSCDGGGGQADPAPRSQGPSDGVAGSSGAASLPSACALRAFPATRTCEGPTGPWAEALQKALWFFHANRCGGDDACTVVQGRGKDHLDDARIRLVPDATDGVNLSAAFIATHRDVLDPDGDGLVDVGGGFHDAGDSIKLGLTTAFSASTLAWSYLDAPGRRRPGAAARRGARQAVSQNGSERRVAAGRGDRRRFTRPG